MSIDWSAPIEAVHEDGRVSRAVIDKMPSEHRDAVVTVHDLTFFCPVNSRGVIKTAPDWTIRNVVTSMTDLSPETVGKLVALVREMGAYQGSMFECEWTRRARDLVSELPEPVDPDLVEARNVAQADVPVGSTVYYLDGAKDDYPLIRCTLAGIKRGRALAAGDWS